MKQIFAPVLALSMLATPLFAQGETPMQMAQRLDACDGREVLGAEINASNELVVRCAREAAARNTGGNGGGNGLLAPALGLAGAAALIGAVAGGSSSSDTQ